jgi:hypothetical protein
MSTLGVLGLHHQIRICSAFHANCFCWLANAARQDSPASLENCSIPHGGPPAENARENLISDSIVLRPHWRDGPLPDVSLVGPTTGGLNPMPALTV